MTYPSYSGTFATFDVPNNALVNLATSVTDTAVVLNAAQTESDLSVSSIDVPSTAVSGQPFQVTFTVQDLGGATPVPSWVDSVYLSSGTAFGPSAILLGRLTHTGGLAAGSSYSASLTVPFPGVIPGNEYVIVLADSRDLVADTNRSNSMAVSSVITTDVTPISYGGSVSGTISAGQQEYFRVDVPPGQDIQVAAGFSTSGEAALYLGADSVPDTVNYDQADPDPAGLNPVIVPTGVTGRYYVLLEGLGSAGTGAPFTLSAGAPVVSLQSLGLTQASNAGSATVPIVGSGFTPSAVVSLVSASGQTLSASAVTFGNETSISATFDLTGLVPGAYDVVVSQGGASQRLARAFSVVSGSAGQFTATVVTAEKYRALLPLNALISYQNTGGDDLVAPLLIVSNTAEAGMSLFGQRHFRDGRLAPLGRECRRPGGDSPARRVGPDSLPGRHVNDHSAKCRTEPQL